MASNNNYVGGNSTQYDPKVKRKSLEDPARQNRRSSIPFNGREPEVRFQRNIEARKASISGPNKPKSIDSANKSILKNSSHPILVSGPEGNADAEGVVSGESSRDNLTTNNELDACHYLTDVIMEKLSRAERIARGGLDVLTFPTCCRRTDPLSRFQGCLLIASSTISFYTKSDEYVKLRKSLGKMKKLDKDSPLRDVLSLVSDMQSEAKVLHKTARKVLKFSSKYYDDWETLLKKNPDFNVAHRRLHYPLYNHKKMPESMTVYEEHMGKLEMEKEEKTTTESSPMPKDGYMRVLRKQLDGNIYLFCDLSNDKSLDEDTMVKVLEAVNFMDSSTEEQEDVIKCLTLHAKNILFCACKLLKQALETLQEDGKLDSAYREINNKLRSLEYDDTFDPYCIIELKNSMGELIIRKNELLNTAEQIASLSRWMVDFTKSFRRFTRKRIKGGGALKNCIKCTIGGSKRKLMSKLMHLKDDVTVSIPLTPGMFRYVFQIIINHEFAEQGAGAGEGGDGDNPPNT